MVINLLKKLFNRSNNNNAVNVNIYAPVSGKIINLKDVTDPVFAQGMMGDGIAIFPNTQVLLAPVEGVIITIHKSKYAVVIKTMQGIEILLHIGIDTVHMNGEGFISFVKEGDSVIRGQKLIEFDIALIAKKSKSAMIMIIITNQNQYILSKNKIKDIEVQAPLLVLSKPQIDNPFQNQEQSVNTFTHTESEQVISKTTRILNHSGLHARPASYIFNLVSKYQAEISLTKGTKIANAKSVIAILGLGVEENEEITITAKGNDAEDAVKTLLKAIKEGLGENTTGDATVIQENNPTTSIVTTASVFADKKKVDFSIEVELKGVVACRGFAVGQAYLLEAEEIVITENATALSVEIAKFEVALTKVKSTITANIEQAKQQKQTNKAEIFQAHLFLLEDISLLENVKTVINQQKTAEFAFQTAIAKSIKVLESTNNTLLMERIADLKDIEKQVILTLLGQENKKVLYPANSILIAKDLIPSDILNFDTNVVGIILAQGSTTSHVAIVLKSIGIPTLVAMGKDIMEIPSKSNLIINADTSSLIINPNQKELATIKLRISEIEKIKTKNNTTAKEKAITLDGKAIIVKGNIGNLEEAEIAYCNGAEGIGLLRTEFLFYNSISAPSEDEQYQLYQSIVDTMHKSGEITFRTLDVGGDKPVSYIKLPLEENPILGKRGVRNYLDNIEIFRNQVRAILRIKPFEMIKIMLPMVSFISEVQDMKEIIKEEQQKLQISANIKVGIMVEVPAVALMAEKFAEYIDFFSIGTNDLAQYTVAMDRGNPSLTSQISNLNPALLKLIKSTVEGGKKYNKPTAVCGAMASELEAIPLLLGLGVEELSVTRSLIADVKALIRELNIKQCEDVAEQALVMENVDEVKERVRKYFHQINY